MPSASDVAPQDPAADPAQEAWRRLTTIEARLEHQDGQMAEIFNTFREFRLYLEQHNTPTVPRDSGPATVQPADAAQTPAHSDPLSAQSFTRGGDRLRPAPPDSFDGEREKGRAFINSCDLYMSLTPDAFPDEQTRINWVLSYMKGGRAARFAARTLRHPNSHGGVPHEKRKAATTFETSAYHQGSRSVDEYIDEFWDLAEEAQFPDGAQLVFRFRHGLDPRIEAKVANIVEGRPSDERIQEWIDAARLVDYNTRAHQDFRSAVTKPRTAPAPAVRNPGAPAVFRALPAPPPRPVAAALPLPLLRPVAPFPLAFRWTLTCPANVPEPHHLSSMQEARAHRPQLPGPIRHPLHDDRGTRRLVMGLLADLDAVRAAASTEAQAEAPAAAEKRGPKVRRRVFSCTTGEQRTPSSTVTKSNFGPPDSDVPEVTINVRCRRGLPRWEKRLPRSFTLAATPVVTPLILGVEVETTDTQEILGLKALLDSALPDSSLHIRFVREHGITTRTLSRPIPVKNVDWYRECHRRHHRGRRPSTPVQRSLGTCGVPVTDLGEQDMILGTPGSRSTTGDRLGRRPVSMSRCPAAARRAEKEVKVERKARNKTRALSAPAAPAASLPPSLNWTTFQSCTRIRIAEDDPPPEANPETDPVPDSREADTMEEDDVSTPSGGLRAHSAPKDFRDAVSDYLHDFEDVFSKAAFDELRSASNGTTLSNSNPAPRLARARSIRSPPMSRPELDAFLEENLSSGLPSVERDNGEEPLSPSLISELINNLRGARYFTKLDVRWGYNNVRIKEGDEWKAAFRTNRGLFEPLVMFFGLTNSPATFQTMMNDIFRDLIAQGVVCVYLDDILIYTKTLEEHRRITRIVLDRLREHRLFLKPEKCEFERTEIEYLGLIISHGTASMDPVKVAE
ncbi:putative reverse transcriptase-rnase h-integrase [Lyophyllum shimeji]|uniref:Reverse transcriptase-rnase h-integrase n=1 Tax=Lyophyllum shimeji TaxID=47721 RepID=A0A9P3ULC1_LYOSH|nr:putative reverse transcriptase-rnase h-integrase [Lyophyllum shimeji]